MSAIVSVKDITGSREQKTLKNVSLSSVFYPAVQEYHDFLETANYDQAMNFIVSSKATNEVIRNVHKLAFDLNGGSLPDSLTILPKGLYSTLKGEEFSNVFLATQLPPEGSQKRENYDSSFMWLRKLITFELAKAYGLPTKQTSDVDNIESLLGISGKTPEIAKKDVKKMLAVKRTNILGFSSLPAVTVLSITLPYGEPLLALAGTFTFGGLGVILGVSSIVETKLNFNKKGNVPFLWGFRKKEIKTAKNEFNSLIKPHLASMENYLLQENKNVDDLIIVQENKSVEKEKV